MRKTELTGADPEHPASGAVIVDGRKLTLENVNITEAPDGRVILTNDHDESSGARIGPLQGFTGTHSYEIPQEKGKDVKKGKDVRF